MELFIYKTFNEWYKDKATEVLQGEIKELHNGLIALDTYEDGKSYRQILSIKNNFAIVYKYPYGFIPSSREINIYTDCESWKKCKPIISFNGEVCEDECSETKCVFINERGFKHIISLDGIYAVTYER